MLYVITKEGAAPPCCMLDVERATSARYDVVQREPLLHAMSDKERVTPACYTSDSEGATPACYVRYRRSHSCMLYIC